MMRFRSFVSMMTIVMAMTKTGEAGSALRGELANEILNENSTEGPSIYDCLQAASGGDECRAACDGQCVWCAEPIYGLCVTQGVADKIGNLPFFTCDSHAAEMNGGESKDEDVKDLSTEIY